MVYRFILCLRRTEQMLWRWVYIYIAWNVHASRLLPPVIGFVYDVAHLSGIFLFFWLEKQKLDIVSQS